MKPAIPRIFYQTWKDKNLPQNFKEHREKWLDSLGPGWNVPLYDDKGLRDLVKDTFPEYIQAYDSFTENIERVDFARYVMMYIGGVYADLDTYPVKSIDFWLNKGKIILGREPIEHAEKDYQRIVVICNAFMISPPRNRFWIDLMDYIIEHYEPHYKPVYNTGPMAITQFMESRPPTKDDKDDVIVTNPCVFFPLLGDGHTPSKLCRGLEDSYVVHVWSNTWVVNPFKDPRWKNRRYWFWFLMGVFFVMWLVLWFSSRK